MRNSKVSVDFKIRIKKLASLPILVVDSGSRFIDLSFHSQLWLSPPKSAIAAPQRELETSMQHLKRPTDYWNKSLPAISSLNCATNIISQLLFAFSGSNRFLSRESLGSRVQWFWHFFRNSICFMCFWFGLEILRLVYKKASWNIERFQSYLTFCPLKKVAPPLIKVEKKFR